MNIDRRNFIKRVSVGAFSMTVAGAVSSKIAQALALPDDIKRAKNMQSPQGLEIIHTPKLKVPMVAEDGRVVPIEMTLDHPMENDHYIEHVTFIVLDDPLVSKGRFVFTPASGKPFIKFQTRMDSGTKKIYAVIECSKHGRWVGEAVMRIVGGGC